MVDPITDEVRIDIAVATTGPAMLSVRDLLGRSIAELDPLIPLDNGQYFLRLDHLAPGTYLLDLQVGERHWTRRIVRA